MAKCARCGSFFNVDLDVWLEIGFWVRHDEDGADVEIRIEFEFDVDFSPLEDVFSFGSAPLMVKKVIESFLPLLLDFQKREIERQLVNQLFENDLVSNALQNGVFFDIRLVPQNSYNHIEIVICGLPPEPEVPSGDVVTRNVTHRLHERGASRRS